MRLKSRFAAPMVLACSLVVLVSHLPSAGGASTPSAPPATAQPISYASPFGHSTGLVEAVQARQLWQATETWNATAAWNEAIANNAATEARRIENRRRVQVASAGSHTPAEATAVAEPVIGSGDVEGAVRAYFGDIFDSAWRVSGCESGHNPRAISPGGGNYGLFQINTAHIAAFKRITGKPYYSGALDAYANAQFARYLYDSSGGWGPWSCRWAA